MVEFAPFILISLPAGVWVDRLRRKPILDHRRLRRVRLLLATVPIAYALDALTIWQLYVVGFLVGVVTVFFDVAYQSYLPSLVDRDQLVEGNSKLEISRSAAQLAGPGLGGAARGGRDGAVCRAGRRAQLRRVGAFLFRIRKREERAPTRCRARRPEAGHADGGEGGPALGLRQPQPACAGGGARRRPTSSRSIVFPIFLVFAVRELGLSAGVIGSSSRSANIGSCRRVHGPADLASGSASARRS